jgi:hypothetical protein
MQHGSVKQHSASVHAKQQSFFFKLFKVAIFWGGYPQYNRHFKILSNFHTQCVAISFLEKKTRFSINPAIR